MTLGSHQSTVGKSQSHLTPRWMIKHLGPFDLDPCASDPRPWDCAATNYTEAEDGLSREWYGFVWLNPPFDRYQVGEWMSRLAAHNNGIALLHARTETAWFRPCWEKGSAILFMAKRIKFCHVNGVAQDKNSGAPPVLVAFGKEAAFRLENSCIEGALLKEWKWN